MKKVGTVLREARQRLEISQSALARKVGIAAAQLSQIESGQRADPYFSSVARIAGALGLSLDEIAANCGVSGFRSKPQTSAKARTAALRVSQELRQVDRELNAALERVRASQQIIDDASEVR